MKQIWKEIGLSLILGIVMPGVILHLAVALSGKEPENMTEATVSGTEANPVYIEVMGDGGQTKKMELEDYITGVVLAEMPASFEPEALKAQAVVARTYTMRAQSGKSKHEGAAVCTESSCCQAYHSAEEYLQSGGKTDNLEKVQSAVRATEGFVLTYEGELIDATYFSCSGGSTEDAVAVWGAEVPYLVATPSPGEEQATHYTDTETFSPEAFAEALNLETKDDPKNWFGPATYTAGGGVASIEICGTEFSGTQLRKLLGLRSTAMEFSVSKNKISVTTRGYGHRVGMSQYGADAMALSGSTYDEILAHYYKGTVLRQLED